MSRELVPRRERRSIAAYAALGVLVTGTVVAVATMVPTSRRLHAAAERAVVDETKLQGLALDQYVRRTRQLALQVTSRTEARRQLEAFLAGDVSLEELRDATARRLADALDLAPDVVGITRLFPDGRVLVELGHAPPDLAALTLPSAGERVGPVSGPHPAPGGAVVATVAAVVSRDGRLVGLDVVSMDPAGLRELIGPRREASVGGRSFLAAEGPILVAPERRTPADRSLREAARLGLAGREGVLIAAGGDGKRILVHRRVPDSPWALIREFDAAEVHGPVDQQVLFTAGLIALLVVGGTVGMIVVLRPVTRALRESEQAKSAMLDAIPDLVLRLGRDGTIREVRRGPGFYLSRPVEDYLGKTLDDLTPPDIASRGRSALARALDTDEVVVFEVDLPWPTGARSMEARLARCGDEEVLVLVREFTEQRRADAARRRLETQLEAAQRLESLGLLAGGVAHDFNNLLMGILGNAALALEDLPDDGPARPHVKQVETAALRAAELTNQLLTYAGRGRVEPEPLDLAEVVRETAALVEVSLPPDARLDVRADEGLPSVVGDVAQVRQVVLNLLTNAAEALDGRPGSVTVRLHQVPDASALTGRRWLEEELAEGPHVMLEVTDDGTGMSDDALARLFEPFFTTKSAGRGLGLAAVLGIVKRHEGALAVDSEVGRGTCVRVVLPVSAVEPVSGAAPSDESAWHGTGTVLVADDDPTVRRVLTHLLERLGFTVVAVADGEEALVAFRERADQLRAVLLDLTMPRKTGEEVAAVIRAECPRLPVILSSGYDAADVSARVRQAGIAAYVQKPYRPEELARTLRTCLEGGPPGAPLAP